MKNSTLLVLFILVLGGAGAWYWFTQRPADTMEPAAPRPVVEAPTPVQPAPEPTYPVEQIAAPEPTAEPEAEPEPPLPALPESDPEASATVAELVGPEQAAEKVVTEGVIPRFIAAIDRMDGRKVPPSIWPATPPEGAFEVVVAEDGTATWAPENAERYAPYVAMLQNLDRAALTEAYLRWYPLMQESYAEIAPPGAYFNDRLVEVIDHLLATPVLETPPTLVKPEAVWLYEDPALEALSAGQKLLIRIGPGNAAVVRAKLRELRGVVTGAPPVEEVEESTGLDTEG